MPENRIKSQVGWEVDDALYKALRSKIGKIATKAVNKALSMSPSLDKAITKYVTAEVDRMKGDIARDPN